MPGSIQLVLHRAYKSNHLPHYFTFIAHSWRNRLLQLQPLALRHLRAPRAARDAPRLHGLLEGWLLARSEHPPARPGMDEGGGIQERSGREELGHVGKAAADGEGEWGGRKSGIFTGKLSGLLVAP